ncbi:methylated-DNA--[protein]-cysteine S-methyltransferase [Bifidobacterium margollesii]
MVMTSDGESLTGLCLEHWWWRASDARCGSGSCGEGRGSAENVFDLTRRWLDEYFAGHDPGFTPPLNPQGSAFRREVWAVVAEIPYGQTMSYGEIAAELAERRGGRRMAAQAVGGAVKHNPITIIVPCHRVVGAGRSFGGYGGRLDVKAALLEHEGVDLTRFDLPES